MRCAIDILLSVKDKNKNIRLSQNTHRLIMNTPYLFSNTPYLLRSKLAEKYLKVVRDSAILQSYEFNKITSDVLDRWQIEPLVRQKGGKAWVTEKKNIQKAS